MALKSLKKPDAVPAGKTLGKKTLAQTTRPATAEAAPTKKSLSKAVVKKEPEPEEEPEGEVEDQVTDLDVTRTELKALIKFEGLPIIVMKSMSDNDIRKAIIAARSAAQEEPEGEEPVAEEPEPEVEEPEAEQVAPKKQLKKIAPKAAKAKEVPIEEVEEESDDKSLAVQTDNARPVYRLGKATGEIDDSLILRPRLEFVQSKGPLFEELDYQPGQIVLGKEVLVWEMNADLDPLRVIVLSLSMMYAEDLEFGSDEFPRVFADKAEARAAGLTTEWQGSGDDAIRPEVYQELRGLILVQRPEYVSEEDGPQFDLEVLEGENPFAMAEFKLSGGGLKAPTGGKYLLTLEKSTLRKGLHTGIMNLSCHRPKGKKNVTTIPIFKLTSRTPEGVVAKIEQIMGEGGEE